jgi:hypothetical protein
LSLASSLLINVEPVNGSDTNEVPYDMFFMFNEKLHLCTSFGQMWLVTNMQPSEVELNQKCSVQFSNLASGPALFNGERILG